MVKYSKVNVKLTDTQLKKLKDPVKNKTERILRINLKMLNVKNDYQHTPKVLFTFVPNKEFGQLINISPHAFSMMNTVNTEFSYVEVWFTDQSSKALEIEDNVNLTLIIG